MSDSGVAQPLGARREVHGAGEIRQLAGEILLFTIGVIFFSPLNVKCSFRIFIPVSGKTITSISVRLRSVVGLELGCMLWGPIHSFIRDLLGTFLTHEELF